MSSLLLLCGGRDEVDEVDELDLIMMGSVVCNFGLSTPL